MGSNLINGMEILVALVATITYYKYRHNTLRYFLWYLWGVVIFELCGAFWPVYFHSSNHIVYNILVVLQFPLLILWYRSFLANPRTKRISLVLVAIYLLFAILNSWILQPFTAQFQSYSFILGAIWLILVIFMFFNEALHTEKILIIQRGLLFWVSVGFLFFYASVIPIMIMGNVLEHSGWVYNVFLLILNIILHTCFLIGLLWGKKKYN